jgi:hypothetical protein
VARPDPRNTSDPFSLEPDLIWFFRKVKLTRPDPNPTWPDPIRDQMTFNSIKIYQRSEKTQYINWPDPIRPWPNPVRPDFFQKIKLTRPVRPEPEPDQTRPIATSENKFLRIKPDETVNPTAYIEAKFNDFLLLINWLHIEIDLFIWI